MSKWLSFTVVEQMDNVRRALSSMNEAGLGSRDIVSTLPLIIAIMYRDNAEEDVLDYINALSEKTIEYHRRLKVMK